MPKTCAKTLNMYRRLYTAPRIRNVGNGIEASGQLSAPAALILVPLHWRPSGTDSPTRKWLTRLSWLLFKEVKEHRRKRILFNAEKDTERKKERKKEVTYECVGTLLSYARIILF
jgi:hypothetical protein